MSKVGELKPQQMWTTPEPMPKELVDEAKKLDAEFQLMSSRQRVWYEDTWTEHYIDHEQLAKLIKKIREEK